MILESIKRLCLRYHYNGANSYIFVNGVKIHKFKAQGSGIKATSLYLGNISKHFSVDNMKNTSLHWYVYDSSVDYDGTAFDNILGLS